MGPVCPVEDVPTWQFDAVLIADLEDSKKAQARLVRAEDPRGKS